MTLTTVDSVDPKYFEKSVFGSDYSFASPQKLKRDAIDAFSKQYCDPEAAEIYSVKYTRGHCFYCDKRLYKNLNGVPFFPAVAHDHGIPVAKWGLYTVGNVVISCEGCNSEKSDLLPVEFYRKLKESDRHTRHKTEQDFLKDWKDFAKPYRSNFPKYYNLAMGLRADLTINEILETYFITDPVTGEPIINFTPITITREASFSQDINEPIWLQMNDPTHKIYENMAHASSVDCCNRINHVRKVFELLFGNDKKLRELTPEEFVWLGDELVASRIKSSGEVNKLRSFMRVLCRVEGMEKYAKAFTAIYTKSELEDMMSYEGFEIVKPNHAPALIMDIDLSV